MEPFRAAQATGDDWRTACRRCLEQLRDLPPSARLGFVYASGPVAEALDLVVEELKRATGIADWAGCGGAGVCSSGHEQFGEGALVVLVTSLGAGDHRVFDALHGAGAASASGLGGGGARLAVVHGDPRQIRAPEAIAGLAAEQGLFLVGGLASSPASAAQIAGRPTEGGLSGVALGAAVPAITGITQGCAPIGPVHEVTACHSRWLISLDGRPALDVLKDEIGDILTRQLHRVSHYIHAALPVHGGDRADYLVRNLLGIDLQQGAIAIAAEVRRGDGILFVKRDGASARKDLHRMLVDLDARRGGRQVRGALYHVCIARGPNLFGPDSRELKLIEAVLGPVPLAGFFANGEIFHDRLYTYTGVLTLFLDDGRGGRS
jgi:small ligand-binding sensory domain FIST